MSQGHTNLGNGRVDALEQRVHRLEDAVAAVQDTRQLEDRVVERVADRVRRSLPSPGDSASKVTVEMRRPMVPSARPALSHLEPPSNGTHTWLLLDIFQDARAILRMFFDHRYRTSRWVGLITVAVGVVVATSWYVRLPIPILGTLINMIVDVALLFVLFKVLTREARRYRATIHD